MQIALATRFRKRFAKLPPKVRQRFEERLALFMREPFHPSLRNHPLTGNLIGYRAFSVTGDYRVLFRLIDTDAAKFIDIGRHQHVYGE